VDVDPLRVLVVPQQGLEMLPAVQPADAAEGGGCHARQGLGLPVAPDGALDVGGLDFAAVEDDFPGGGDEGLDRYKFEWP
jgi:hypothetical protein